MKETIVYELSNGLIGTASELIEKLGTTKPAFYQIEAQKRTLKGVSIKKYGRLVRLYEAYKNGELVACGEKEEIAKKIYMSPKTVKYGAWSGKKVYGEYEIKCIGKGIVK